MLVLIVCAGLAGHYAGSLQASVPPVPAHGVAPMPTEEALAPTTPAEVHSSMPFAPGCQLAIVVQGPAAGGLPANKGEQRNYVGLFAHGQPPPAWSLPEGVLRVPFDFSGVLRIFSTWYTTNPQELELIEAYRAAGFHIALSNLTEARDKFTDGGLMPTAATGRSTLNLQIQSAHAGVALARELGASHALKMRSDIFIRDWSAFLEAVGGEQGGKECPARLTFVHWFDYSAQIWAGQHFVPSPHDVLYMGPIELMEAYTGVGFQSPRSHVFGELWQFDEYCYKRGVSRLKGCHDSDFLYPRLPKNVVLWMHPASTGPFRDMIGDPTLPHMLCRCGESSSCRELCGAADKDVCPPYSFGSRDGPCPPACK
jgi:hypothetical protein